MKEEPEVTEEEEVVLVEKSCDIEEKSSDIEESKDLNKEVKKADRKEHLSYLDLAETLYNWFNRYRNVVKGPKSVCSLCEKGTENFKYCMVEFRDKVAALEDLAEKWYKWKGQDNVHEEKRK